MPAEEKNLIVLDRWLVFCYIVAFIKIPFRKGGDNT